LLLSETFESSGSCEKDSGKHEHKITWADTMPTHSAELFGHPAEQSWTHARGFLDVRFRLYDIPGNKKLKIRNHS
jgi:hypothetical protein